MDSYIQSPIRRIAYGRGGICSHKKAQCEVSFQFDIKGDETRDMRHPDAVQPVAKCKMRLLIDAQMSATRCRSSSGQWPGANWGQCLQQ